MNQMKLMRENMIKAMTTGGSVIVCVDEKKATIAADILLGNVELKLVPEEEYDAWNKWNGK